MKLIGGPFEGEELEGRLQEGGLMFVVEHDAGTGEETRRARYQRISGDEAVYEYVEASTSFRDV